MRESPAVWSPGKTRDTVLVEIRQELRVLLDVQGMSEVFGVLTFRAGASLRGWVIDPEQRHRMTHGGPQVGELTPVLRIR